MAFPTVVNVATSHVGTNTTTPTINLPDGCNVSGRLVIVAIAKDDDPAITWPSSPAWTELSSGASGGTPAAYMSVRYRIIDGTEGWSATGQTISVTADSETYAAWAILLSDWHGTTPPEAASATGASGTAADPPSLTPSWGAADTLWLALSGRDSDGGYSGYPTNYTGNQHADASAAGSGQCSHAACTRQLNATSDDPGAFGGTGGDWRATTVAIRPAAGGGGGGVVRSQAIWVG